MLKLFSAFDLFSSELPTTKIWGFPSIYFRGQVEVKCQCEEEGRIKSPIQYYFGIQCPVNTNKSVLLEFVGVFLLLKLRPHGKRLTISRCETEKTISNTEKLYFSQWGGLLQLGFTELGREGSCSESMRESTFFFLLLCSWPGIYQTRCPIRCAGKKLVSYPGRTKLSCLAHTSSQGLMFTCC